MDIAIQTPTTLSDFLAWEERQELRYEFDGQRAIAMNGGTIGHETIGANLRRLLYDFLVGTPYRVFGPTLKVEVAGHIRYPDAFVSRAVADRTQTVMPEPVVVFEVISPGSSRNDRFAKLREYQATPSIQQYVILEQDSVAAMVFTRSGDIWDARSLLRADTLSMRSIGVDIALLDIYVDLDLPDLDDENDPPPTA